MGRMPRLVERGSRRLGEQRSRRFASGADPAADSALADRMLEEEVEELAGRRHERGTTRADTGTGTTPGR